MPTSVETFYRIRLPEEQEEAQFYPEYSILIKTIDSVNNFNSIYRTKRAGSRGGPSTHEQQDLYRAMLIFACAGLDVFIKQLIKMKLPKIIEHDNKAQIKFKDYVRRGMKRDDKEILNTLAFALIDQNPRTTFLNEYIGNMTGESLQSTDQLCKFSDASGLDTGKIFSTSKLNQLKDAFLVRNQIIHEMDINVIDSNPRTTAYRTRRQRVATAMERHTKNILRLATEIFVAYKTKFKDLSIGVTKGDVVS